jgi:pyochelin biosynthetic protein PchC
VCFPHAGGSAGFYYQLAKALPDGIEVMAIQYPGRAERYRERCVEDVDVLADEAFAALRPWADRPVALFGHSMGAIVGYEVARRFASYSGERLLRLFVSARQAPSLPWNRNIHCRDDVGLIAELRRVGGGDQRWLDDEEMVAYLLPTVRSDYKAIESYTWSPGPPLGCPITAIVGENDPYTTVEGAAGWSEHCAGEFELHVLPGGHFLLDDNRARVTQIFAAALAAVSLRS